MSKLILLLSVLFGLGSFLLSQTRHRAVAVISSLLTIIITIPIRTPTQTLTLTITRRPLAKPVRVV
jgi:hypothetical protein